MLPIGKVSPVQRKMLSKSHVLLVAPREIIIFHPHFLEVLKSLINHKIKDTYPMLHKRETV